MAGCAIFLGPSLDRYLYTKLKKFYNYSQCNIIYLVFSTSINVSTGQQMAVNDRNIVRNKKTASLDAIYLPANARLIHIMKRMFSYSVNCRLATYSETEFASHVLMHAILSFRNFAAKGPNYCKPKARSSKKQ